MLLNENESKKVNFKRTRKNSLLPLLKPKNRKRKRIITLTNLEILAILLHAAVMPSEVVSGEVPMKEMITAEI